MNGNKEYQILHFGAARKADGWESLCIERDRHTPIIVTISFTLRKSEMLE